MSQFLKEVIDGEKFELVIDTGIFSKDIILKSAYNFLDKGYFFFKFDENENIILEFTKKSDVQDTPESIIGEFSDELLNVYLRDKLEKDNKVIRETIVTKAINGPLDFQNYVSLDTDNKHNPQQDEIDFDRDIDDILKEIENDPDLKIDEQEIENILREIEEETELSKPQVIADPSAVADLKNKFKKQ